MCACARVPACASVWIHHATSAPSWRSQTFTSGVFFSCFLPLLLRQGLSSNLELADQTRPVPLSTSAGLLAVVCWVALKLDSVERQRLNAKPWGALFHISVPLVPFPLSSLKFILAPEWGAMKTDIPVTAGRAAQTSMFRRSHFWGKGLGFAWRSQMTARILLSGCLAMFALRIWAYTMLPRRLSLWSHSNHQKEKKNPKEWQIRPLNVTK